MATSDRPTRLMLAAIGVGAFAAFRRWAGPSPLIWSDTLIDQQQVDRCLHDGVCSGVGNSVFVSGIQHEATWWHLRVLLGWLGVGINGAHGLMIGLDALSVVLVAWAADRLAGRGPAALAVLLYWFLTPYDGVTRWVLNNTSPLPFLGALLLAACIAARGRMWALIPAALVAAVTVNIHATAVPLGISLLWVALLVKQHRLASVLFAGTFFSLATRAFAPDVWEANVAFLLSPHFEKNTGLSGFVLTQSHSLLLLAGAIALLWFVGLAVRPLRNVGLDVPVAVFVPQLGLIGLAARAGAFHESPAKYMAVAHAAVAVGAAVALGPAFQFARNALDWSPARTAWSGLLLIVPYTIGGWLFGFSRQISSVAPRSFTESDAQAVASHIGGSWHSDYAHLDAPDGPHFLRALHEYLPTASTTPEDPHDITVLKVPDETAPLPDGWQVVRQASGYETLVARTTPWLDWSNYHACTQSGTGAEFCSDGSRTPENDRGSGERTSLADLPGPGTTEPFTLMMTIPIRPPPGATEARLVLPAIDGCHGRILSAGYAPSTVAPDGESATLEAASHPTALVVTWNVGSETCPSRSWSGFPWIIDGEPATVDFIRNMLAKGTP